MLTYSRLLHFHGSKSQCNSDWHWNPAHPHHSSVLPKVCWKCNEPRWLVIMARRTRWIRCRTGTYSWRMPPSRIPLTPWQFWRTERTEMCSPKSPQDWNTLECPRPHQSPWWQFHRQPWINGINHLTAPHQDRLRACLNHNSCTVLLVDSGVCTWNLTGFGSTPASWAEIAAQSICPQSNCTIFVRERITAKRLKKTCSLQIWPAFCNVCVSNGRPK